MSEIGHIAATILRRGHGRRRALTAIAGAPASGKSTLAAAIAEAIANAGETVAVVSMDGFHFDDAVLSARGDRDRKGAPHTFDFDGFHSLLERLKRADRDVAAPVFDRSTEISRAAATVVPANAKFVIVEGNYLLYDDEPWRALAPLFDFTLFLDVPRGELERRLVERWRMHGKSEEASRAWIAGNDMPNIDLVLSRRRQADLVIKAQSA